MIPLPGFEQLSCNTLSCADPNCVIGVLLALCWLTTRGSAWWVDIVCQVSVVMAGSVYIETGWPAFAVQCVGAALIVCCMP